MLFVVRYSFIRQDITLDMIPDLTTEEFAHLGISIGQKQKVLALVSKKTATTTAAAATAEVCGRKKVLCADISYVDQ